MLLWKMHIRDWCVVYSVWPLEPFEPLSPLNQQGSVYLFLSGRLARSLPTRISSQKKDIHETILGRALALCVAQP